MWADKKHILSRATENGVLYFCAALMLFLHACSWICDQTLSVTFTQLYDNYRIVLFCGIILLLLAKRKWNYSPKTQRCFAFVCVFLCLYLVNSKSQGWFSPFFDLFFVPLIALMFLLGLSKNKEDIWKTFSNLVCAISIISLVFYIFGTLLHVISPMTYVNREWGAWDPIPIANYYYVYYEAQLTHHAGFDLWRNCGLFTEATMFSSLLCVALASECFLFKRARGRKFVIVLLATTIITTFSTTGLLFLVVCGLICFLRQEKIKAFIHKRKAVLAIGVIGFVFVGGVIIAMKFTTSAGLGSASVRLDHTVTCIKLLKNNLLFGYGWQQQQTFLETAKFSQGPSVGIPYYLYTGGLVLGALIVGPYFYSLFNSIKAQKYNLVIFNTLFLYIFFFTAISSYPLVQLFIAYNVVYSFDESKVHESKPSVFSVRSTVLISVVILLCACSFVVVAGKLKTKYSVRRITDIDEIVSIEEPYLYDVNDICLKSDFRSDSWFYIRGWFIEQGVDSSTQDFNLVLVDQNSGISYRLPTNMVIRTDVTNVYGNGTNLDESGFTAYLLLDDLFADEYYDYDLIFEVKCNGEVTYFDPHISLTQFYESDKFNT